MSDWTPQQRNKGIPREFPPPERSYALYEGIEYHEHWDGSHQARQDALERHILSSMLPASGRRIIDVGCGYGRLAPVYVDRFEQVVLYDGSVSLLQEARNTLGNRVVLVAGDISRLPFRPMTFDCLLTIRVLQHARDLPTVLGGMGRVIAPEGRIVFSYYNKRNAHRVLRYDKARKSGSPFSQESAEVSPTLIAHHPDRFESYLLDAGFSAPEYKGAVVVDSLARAGDRLGRRAPAGAGWASFMGRFRLAPWLIGSASANGSGTLVHASTLDEILVCPVCHGDLENVHTAYECSACKRTYPIDDDIYDFRC